MATSSTNNEGAEDTNSVAGGIGNKRNLAPVSNKGKGLNPISCLTWRFLMG